MSTFYKLTIKEVQRETEDAVSLLFDIPTDLQEKFKFTPGQYITIKATLNSQEVRRAYSICSSLQSNTIRIGIKAVEGGTFSIYATNNLKAGDVLEVSPPEGRFLLAPNAIHQKNYLAFVAGSGITPVLSMLSSVLEKETNSTFVLVFGNKSSKKTMFKDEIDSLQSQFPNRLFVYYIFSQSNESDTLFGRIDTSTVNYILKNKHKGTDFDASYLCGPEAMINLVKTELLAASFSENQIYYELFSAKIEDEPSSEDLSGETEITIVLDDEEETFIMDKQKTILEVALAKGLDAPYSCQGGICSSCLAQVTEGKAVLEKNSILSDKEVEEGLILTCQAHPTTANITIDYDAV